ncbi:MAG: ERF family protein [Candidatus Methanomethylophilaceae archaeon]|jgi:hypothetical protein
MNIYEKLLEARIILKKQGIKQGGKNEYAKYTYYELADFVPAITDICKEVRIIPMVTFPSNAVMTITDLDKPDDKIIFESPMSTANLKGCHEVQNLGAVETYLRRYLYQTAFEIIESDFVDASTKNPSQEKTKFDKTAELAEFELRVNASDWDEEKKRLTILGLPRYSDKILGDLDAKLKKGGF